MAGSDKENHVADKQADELSVPNTSPYSDAHSATGVSPIAITVPSLSRAGIPAVSYPPVTGVPVTSSRCTPVTGSTSLLVSSQAGDHMSAVTRFVYHSVTELHFSEVFSFFDKCRDCVEKLCNTLTV